MAPLPSKVFPIEIESGIEFSCLLAIPQTLLFSDIYPEWPLLLVSSFCKVANWKKLCLAKFSLMQHELCFEPRQFRYHINQTYSIALKG